jgi:arylsulfatase
MSVLLLVPACSTEDHGVSTVTEPIVDSAPQDGSEPASSPTPDNRPNILLIVADDMGYSDAGVFGGEIDTPNIDSLAGSGVKLTQFYATPSCSPTRAMLMSGLDTHQAGLGNMAEWMSDNQRGHPGYEGVLNDRVVSVATLLSDAGYHTYMAGKWHLGHKESEGPAARGFDKSFALLNGSAMHFDIRRPSIDDSVASYREDGVRLRELPPEFQFSSDFYTDYLIRNIGANLGDDKPFFAWAAYTAPHWPLQVPEKYSDKYVGKYDAGYEVLREKRLQRMKELGVVPATAVLPPLPDGVVPWDELTPEQRAIDAREMEIYAGMVDNLDENIGRLINYLKETGEYENTLIFFMSDNGADAGDVLQRKAFVEYKKQFEDNFESMGGPDSFINYGREWAHATTSPFKLWKTFATEGGLRVPAIISMPGATAGGNMSGQVLSAKDVMPTFLDIAGIRHPGSEYRGRQVTPINGKSMLPLLSDSVARIHGDDYQFAFEIIGRSALRRGDWKLARIDKPHGSGEWELHDLAADPGELRDLSVEYPDVMEQMLAWWKQYEQEMKIVYPDAGGLH